MGGGVSGNYLGFEQLLDLNLAQEVEQGCFHLLGQNLSKLQYVPKTE